ncbi:MAG: zinc-ribbon domain-containing protein [Ruminococcaceae bacterium]|nr:zinc-ribbon domain-containing protein [Oscillospiraceae bacterium]
MYCQDCGSRNNDGAKFCRQCGTELIDVSKMYQKAPENNAPVQNTVFSGQSALFTGAGDQQRINPVSIPTAKKKVPTKLIAIATTVLVVIAVAVSLLVMSKKPCIYCGDDTLKKFKISDGSVYVCSNCSDDCAFCGQKAKHYYESVLGPIMFVCDDCCEELSSW